MEFRHEQLGEVSQLLEKRGFTELIHSAFLNVGDNISVIRIWSGYPEARDNLVKGTVMAINQVSL
jgi:hypothetical protein